MAVTEEIARIVYEAMRFDRDYDTTRWEEGGNLLAQDRAREAADQILEVAKLWF